MGAGQVLRYAGDRSAEVVADLGADRPGGLGWLPDGRLLVVAMERRVVYVVGPDGALSVHADLTGLTRLDANDMVVAADGTAYVTQTGFDLFEKTTPIGPTELLRVDPSGAVTVAADGLLVPNGVALDPTGTVLTVAETWGERVTRFTVGPGAALVDRRTLAAPPPAEGARHFRPDGLCLDAEDAVWVADFAGRRVLRIDADGLVTTELTTRDHPLAVVLGSHDRRQLFVCLVPAMGRPPRDGDRGAHVDVTEVPVPGAGRP
jgi:sugar lactone lactonase YvrE